MMAGGDEFAALTHAALDAPECCRSMRHLQVRNLIELDVAIS